MMLQDHEKCMKKIRPRVQSVLFVFTGIAAAIPVSRAILISLWGAPTSVFEGIALLGCGILVVAGIISFSQPRQSIKLAATGLLCIWTLYGPASVYFVWHHFTTRTVQILFYGVIPGNSPLHISGYLPNGNNINPDELNKLVALGVKGELRWVDGEKIEQGKVDRLLVIADHGLEKSVELREPYKADIIYLQKGHEWMMIPSDARTSRRVLRLSPDLDHPGALLFEAQGTFGFQGAAAYVNFFNKRDR
jgi:hypothetical protein